MALDVLHDAEVARAIDVEVDDGVDAGIGLQALAQLTPSHRHGHRVGAEPVDDRGDLAFAAQPAARTGAGRAGRVCGEDEFHCGACSLLRLAPGRPGVAGLLTRVPAVGQPGKSDSLRVYPRSARSHHAAPPRTE